MSVPAQAMPARRFGSTDVSLSALGFGGAALGNLYREISDDDARCSVEAALQAGLRYLDTAPHYGFGLGELRLGAALAEFDAAQQAIVSSKVGRVLDPVPDADLRRPRQGFISPLPVESVFDYSYDGVMRSYEESRRRLQRPRIDILYAHDLGQDTHGAAHPRRFREFMDGGYRAMRELRDGGAVAAIGLGVNEWQVCEQALTYGDFDGFLLAGRYTLLEQGALDTFLPLCAQRGVSIVVGGPFNSGILARGVRGAGPHYYNYAPAPPAVIERVRRIETVCDAFDVPLAAAALQFPLAHPQVASVIAGMASPAEVDRAVALAALPIPPQLWATLSQQALLHPAAPWPQAIAAPPLPPMAGNTGSTQS